MTTETQEIVLTGSTPARKRARSIKQPEVGRTETVQKMLKTKRVRKLGHTLPVSDPTAGDMEIPKDKKGNWTARGLPCLFSGEQTITPKAKFLSGNDARLKSVILKVLKGDAKMEDLPPLARRWMTVTDVPLVGYLIRRGKLVEVKPEGEDGE